MHPISVTVFALVCCYVAPSIAAEENTLSSGENHSSTFDQSISRVENDIQGYSGSTTTLNRQKRTLFLKKKLIGAGLLGFGLGIAKGYKAAHYNAPQVRHVYLSPPPASVKYVEYVEKPIFIERIVERPTTSVFKPIHAEYKDPLPYGAW